jgi:hypothetical protein
MKPKALFACSILLPALLAFSDSRGQEVLAGLDFLETNSLDTYEDLSNLGLLCPGCFVIGDPLIQLKGVPLKESSACEGAKLGKVDTIIRRRQDTSGLADGGPPVQVQIEIVELHLQSVQPFQVNCGGQDQLWMLDVTVNPTAQPIGFMQIQKTHPNGGTFDSFLPVVPFLTFSRVDDCPPTIVCQATGPIINFNAVNAPWVHETLSLGFKTLEVPGCTTNFIAGVDGLGGGGLRSLTPGFNEAAMLRAHGVLPPLPPKLEQHTWQEAVHFTFWMTNPGGKAGVPAVDALRFSNPRYVPMVGDPDYSVYFKSNSICNMDTLWTPCPTSWCRVNWDSLSPDYRREAHWFFPPVPTDSMAPEMDIVFSLPDSNSCYFKPDKAWYEVDVECYFLCALVDTGTFRFHCDPLNPTTGSPESSPIRYRVGSLDQNFPNPFRPNTTISFALDRATEARLTIYDVQGRVVRVLADGFRAAGDHSVEWDGTDANGRRVAAGAYFYELQTSAGREAKKMIHLR